MAGFEGTAWITCPLPSIITAAAYPNDATDCENARASTAGSERNCMACVRSRARRSST